MLARRLVFLVLVFLGLVSLGTLGYYLIEKEFTLFEALYMTVITLTTVGFDPPHKLSTAGRVFTIFLLLGGVFTLIHTATELIRIVISGEIQQVLGTGLMERSQAAL